MALYRRGAPCEHFAEGKISPEGEFISPEDWDALGPRISVPLMRERRCDCPLTS